MINKRIIFYLNCFILILLIAFFTYKFRFYYVMNDDICDLIANNIITYHGRFLTQIISIMIVKTIPLLFNINIQDFAIFSEVIFKGIFITTLSYIISKSFFIDKRENIFSPFLITISFFTIFFFLFSLNFMWIFDTLQFSMGYLFPMIFFLYLWYKIFYYYIKDVDYNNKDRVYLIISSIFVATGNIAISISTLFICLFLYIDLKRKKQNFEYLNDIFISIFSINIIAIITHGFASILDVHNIPIEFSYNMKDVSEFLFVTFKKLIIDNILLCTVIAIGIIQLLLIKDKRKTLIIKFLIYTYLSFLIFFFSLYLLGETYRYEPLERDKIFPLYWSLYPGFLIEFKILLLSSFLLISGYLIKNKNPRIIIYNGIILLSGIILFYSFSVINNFKEMFPINNDKQILYIVDKITIFYLSKGETAIIPKELPFYIIPDIRPIKLNITPQLYQKVYTREEASYLKYIEKNYKIDAEPGLTLTSFKNAMDLYRKDGGKLTNEEVNKLKFSRIKNN